MYEPCRGSSSLESVFCENDRYKLTAAFWYNLRYQQCSGYCLSHLYNNISFSNQMKNFKWTKKNKVRVPITLHPRTTKGNFEFQAPTSVDIIGSYALDTAIRPSSQIDLAVQIPKASHFTVPESWENTNTYAFSCNHNIWTFFVKFCMWNLVRFLSTCRNFFSIKFFYVLGSISQNRRMQKPSSV